MPVYMCRWPNGDLSFVSARNRKNAIVQLDEWGDAEALPLTEVENFMVDFRLADDAELELNSLGESAFDAVWTQAYPVLNAAKSAGNEEEIAAAVETERQRWRAGEGPHKQSPVDAETEAGRDLQKRLGVPATLANRLVKRTARKILRQTPVPRRKQ